MTALERLVRNRWIGWGDYAGWRTCAGCGRFRYCRSRRRGRALCLECFDQR
jgi:hypothetical protein